MNQMNKPSTLILTMPALLVRAHKTDTNAWYPVAASQPRASTVHGRRRGNAHHRRRGEESTENPGQGWANAKREAMANGSEEWFYSTNDNSSLDGTAWPNQRKERTRKQHRTMLGGCHVPITQEGMGKEVLELCFLNDARWQK